MCSNPFTETALHPNLNSSSHVKAIKNINNIKYKWTETAVLVKVSLIWI